MFNLFLDKNTRVVDYVIYDTESYTLNDDFLILTKCKVGFIKATTHIIETCAALPEDFRTQGFIFTEAGEFETNILAKDNSLTLEIKNLKEQLDLAQGALDELLGV